MNQARSWHVGTLNELRKFMDLTPHKSFQDINPDPEIQAAMKALYKEPDFVELYPGVIFEEAKKPVYPGSGLCGGYTITRAILSDAVALTRGDRFYTLVSYFIYSFPSYRRKMQCAALYILTLLKIGLDTNHNDYLGIRPHQA